MEQIHNLDWIIAGILAYGLVAGMVRGFLQQFTRLFVLVVAILLASSWNPLVGWLADSYAVEGDSLLHVRADVELFLFLLSFLVLLLLRRTILGWLGSPAGVDARAAGAMSGFIGVVLLSTLFLGHQGARMDAEEHSRLFFVTYLQEPVVKALGLLPVDWVPTIVQPSAQPKPEVELAPATSED